ncbi:hypothetical protein D3C87_2122910 [compost metagenome]
MICSSFRIDCVISCGMINGRRWKLIFSDFREALFFVSQPRLRELPLTSTVISPHCAETLRAVSSALIAA